MRPKTGYQAGIPRLLFSRPRHLHQLGTGLDSCLTAGCVYMCRSLCRLHEEYGDVIRWLLEPAAPHQEVSAWFYRRARETALHISNFPPHILSVFLLFSFLPPATSRVTCSTPLLVLLSPLFSLLLPLLDSNPQVVEMPVPLFLLLVPPLFLQHPPLRLLQQLQAVRRQEHVG